MEIFVIFLFLLIPFEITIVRSDTQLSFIQNIINNARSLFTSPASSAQFRSLSSSSSNLYRRREVLDEAVDFVVEWEVDRSVQKVFFNISAKVNGYVAFGLSRTGQVEGSDMVIIGLGADLQDMHGVDSSGLAMDVQQDWKLLSKESDAKEGVKISISRSFDTCDEEDIVMNNDLTSILWGYDDSIDNIAGDSVTEPLQFFPQGRLRTYLLDPKVEPNPTDKLQTFRLSRTFRIPPKRTTYWCTIHRGNRFRRKHHIVGYSAYFASDLARQHIHHQIVYRCISPPGVEASVTFDKFTNNQGEECYLEKEHELPTNYCLEVIGMWGVGGKDVFFPENIGFPIGEASNEYFMLESHYDNQDERVDLVVENGMDFLYTSQLRSTDGSMIFIGTSPLGLYMVPPKTTNFKIAGMCSSQCTQRMIPTGGMNILGAVLHAHTKTHKFRFRHFRGNTELPWILHDENYDYSFQQFRAVPEPRKVLPGDVLAAECVMSTLNTNRTTLSGFSTKDEMCVAFAIVSKYLPHIYCISEYPTETTMSRYGIADMTWDGDSQERIINFAANASYVGRKFSDFLDAQEHWTSAKVIKLEREQYEGYHNVYCPQVRQYTAFFSVALAAQRIARSLLNFSFDFNAINIVGRPTTRSVRTAPIPDSIAALPRRATLYRPPDLCHGWAG